VTRRKKTAIKPNKTNYFEAMVGSPWPQVFLAKIFVGVELASCTR